MDITPTSIQSVSSSSTIPKELWKTIWNSKVHEKVKHFIWSLCNNSIPTREALCKKRIANNPSFPICNSEVESLEYLFLMCPWTEPCWFQFS